MPSTERPFSRQVLREDIKEYILSNILRGDYSPGERLIETKIAKDLGLSQAPVREALRDLEMLGFVQSEPYKGTHVRSLTLKEMYDIYQIRLVLEVLGVKLAAEQITQDQIIQLMNLYDEIITYAGQNDLMAFIQTTLSFHESIARISGNHLLPRFIDTLQLAYWLRAFTTVTAEDMRRLTIGKQAIVDTLRQRDADQAAACMEKHIKSILEWIQEHNEQNEAN